jgi:PAT family beta-lactamase induction signal transducer AmpG
VWGAIALFTLLSATNDIAIDGYTIEYLARDEMGLANGIRIGFYRVGMLATGAVLVIADHWSWRLAFLVTALVLFAAAAACLAAPREAERAAAAQRLRLGAELSTVARDAWASALVLAFFLGALALADKAIGLGAAWPDLWRIAGAGALLVWLALRLLPSTSTPTRLRDGPLFGALFALLARPGIAQVLAFILLFKLADAAMGFMVKPFWVDRGFSAAEIGLVSVNLGLLLSIAGGVCGGLYCDRAGIFRALWLLGLAQAASNLGYAAAAWYVPPPQPGIAMALEYQIAVYAASGIESFTGGMGTAAFLAFLMALVNKRAAATEYALLSSVFALSRSVAGWAGGYAAQAWGYAEFFFFSAFLAAPAYLFLPWVRRALDTRTEAAP